MNTIAGVRIPASTANLGPGFDALSLALNLYLSVRVEARDPGHLDRVAAVGVDSEKVPKGPDNLIVRVMERVAERRGYDLPPVFLRVLNEIPLSRGLGSSATAILAGISCYEIVSGESVTQEEIFDYAMEFEPHPDNLAAALFGGLTVSATRDRGAAIALKLGVSESVSPVLVIPDFELSTDKARTVLPDAYSRTDTVFNVQRAALVVAALTTGHWDVLSEAMRDRIHQPYRTPLIPGFGEVLTMDVDGLVGISLSGAGPSVLALAEPSQAAAIGQKIVDVFERAGVAAVARVSKIDTKGRQFLTTDVAVDVPEGVRQ